VAYTPDPTDVTNPFDTVDASTAAAEFRALKGYISTLVGGGGFPGVNVFRKNTIIGGDFDTNPWQRGTNFAAIATATYSADRWIYTKVGTMVETLSKVLDAPVLNTVYKNRTMDIFAQNCLQSNITTAEAILGAGDFSGISQRIEGYNFKLLAQVPIVLSFWHKHTKVGTYCVAFQNSIQDRSYVAEYTQAVSNVWEYDSIAVPASPIAGTWDYTNGIGLTVFFCKGSGATFQTAANIWTVGNFVATVNQVNSHDANANKFQLALVQFEAGSIASKFERRSIQEEIALCQRYYEKSFFMSVTPAQNVGQSTGEARSAAILAGVSTVYFPNVEFKIPKRSENPTIVTYNPGAANANARNFTLGADGTGFLNNFTSSRCFSIYPTVAAGTGVNNFIGYHWTADSEL